MNIPGTTSDVFVLSSNKSKTSHHTPNTSISRLFSGLYGTLVCHCNIFTTFSNSRVVQHLYSPQIVLTEITIL